MRWIETDHITSWATRFDAIAKFPTLLQSLVRSSSSRSSFINFPDGKQIFNSGLDGYVESKTATHEVPEGISIWELGTSPNYEEKADGDYDKRTNKPKGYDPATSTFIFVTPHSWAGKANWVNKKMAEGKWREIRVYDCANLAAWLENAEVVARDYAPIISSYPSDNVQTTNDFWFEWSSRQNGITLPPNIITAGREYQIEQIKTFLAGTANVRAVVASSKEEAIAFIIACAKQFEEEEEANFFSKSLIVDSENSFRNISSKRQSLILISRVESNIVHRGALEENHVFLPLGADDTYSGDVIILPRVDKNGMINALCSTGMSNYEAQKFVREAGHNITILKKLLHFPLPKSDWAKPENAREVIPSILIERWDENKNGDKEILAKVTGKPYEDYIEELVKWKTNEIPFIYQIGTTWRLTSPLDAWSNLSAYVTKNDLQKLETSFLEVLTYVRPALDLSPEKRQMAEIWGEEADHSSWLREGLIQSLILIAVYGDNMKLPTPTTSQKWVDNVILKLLNQAGGKLWSTLNYVVPLLAEASPTSFLYSIEQSLKKKEPELLEMFEEEPSLITNRSHHTGLLWGLEGLAWLPEFLPRVSLILGKLSRMDPGGSLSNRPINTLRSIFLPWMPQTYADTNKRMDAIRLISKNEPEVGWRLLISLLPKHRDIAHPTHKTRWRLFGESLNQPNVTHGDIWNFHTQAIKDLLNLAGLDEKKLGQLIEQSDEFSPGDRQLVTQFIKDNVKKIDQKDYSIWHAARKMLHNHRSHPDAAWALHESSLEGISYLYKELFPLDTLHRYEWLFEESWPEFSEGYDYVNLDHNQHQEEINKKRNEGLYAIIDQYGISKVIELSDQVKEKWAFGHSLANIISGNREILQFLSNDRLADKENYAVKGFINRKEQLNGFKWVIELFEQLKQIKYSSIALANFLTSLDQNQQLWNYVEPLDTEVSNYYWTYINPYLYHLSLPEKIYSIKKLLEVNRGLTAIAQSYRDVPQLETDLVVRILEEGVSSTERIRFPSHEIEQIFEQLDKRQSIEKNVLAGLEWMYLTILAGSYSRRSPKILHEELSNNPEFFVQILKFVYKPKEHAPEIENLNDKEKKTIIYRAEQAYNLLTSWKKLPGSDDNNNIDLDKLSNWVLQARDLALKEGRLDPADIHIGRIFANFPIIPNEQWPPDAIAEIIDTLNSDAITRSFETELFNKNGFSSKAPYEGGDRERKLASDFNGLAEKIGSKWPVTASALKNLTNRYLEDAKREDERAQRDSLEY